jgi:hypothetical protein
MNNICPTMKMRNLTGLQNNLMKYMTAFAEAFKPAVRNYTLQFILLLFCILSGIQQTNAQGLAGSTIENAIDAGALEPGFSFSHSANNADNYGNEMLHNSSNDIYYKFKVTSTTKVNLSHCGSGFDTYMHLIDSTDQANYKSVDDGGGVACSGSTGYWEASMVVTLEPGTYYVVSEGYLLRTGNINTQISVPCLEPPVISAGSNLLCNGDSTLLTSTLQEHLLTPML